MSMRKHSLQSDKFVMIDGMQKHTTLISLIDRARGGFRPGRNEGDKFI